MREYSISSTSNFISCGKAKILLLLIFILILSIVPKMLNIKTKKLDKDASDYVVKYHYIHYPREFLPVVLIVWVLRAFLFEAYQIPSSSMRPNLIVGDFIVVNKFIYGLREPFLNKIIINIKHPSRGDVVVFKDPNNKNRDLIKRVIGVAGDKIEYYNKQLTINNIKIKLNEIEPYSYKDTYVEVGDVVFYNHQYAEDLVNITHKIITDDRQPTVFADNVKNFLDKQVCNYKDDNTGFTCIVPKGKYFMMGDNRDNSDDSRYWGFVTEDSIIGRAIYVWFNFKDFRRIGVKI